MLVLYSIFQTDWAQTRKQYFPPANYEDVKEKCFLLEENLRVRKNKSSSERIKSMNMNKCEILWIGTTNEANIK